MGFRFHKSVSLGKGVRVNLSKSGPSLSVGGRGHSVTFSKKGTYGNVGIPGTGMSYREKISGGGKSSSGCGCLSVVVLAVVLAGALALL